MEGKPTRNWALVFTAGFAALQAVSLIIAAKWVDELDPGQFKNIAVGFTILVPVLATAAGFVFFLHRWIELGFADWRAERADKVLFKLLNKKLPESAKELLILIVEKKHGTEASYLLNALKKSRPSLVDDYHFNVELLKTCGLITVDSSTSWTEYCPENKGVLYVHHLRQVPPAR